MKMEIPKIELEQIIYMGIGDMLDATTTPGDQDAITCAKNIIKKIRKKEKIYENLKPGIAGVTIK